MQILRVRAGEVRRIDLRRFVVVGPIAIADGRIDTGPAGVLDAAAKVQLLGAAATIVGVALGLTQTCAARTPVPCAGALLPSVVWKTLAGRQWTQIGYCTVLEDSVMSPGSTNPPNFFLSSVWQRRFMVTGSARS